MLNLYDSCPHSLETQQERLKAACTLSQAGIKCLVWGEDALSFIYFVPTVLFPLHLVVEDHQVSLASQKVMETLPYEVLHGSPDRNYLEYKMMDPSQRRIYPNSVHLKNKYPVPVGGDEPDLIFIHPHSQVHLNLEDASRSITLPQFPQNILFPTRIAFIDSIIDILLDHSPGPRSTVRLASTLKTWFAYICTYTLRNFPTLPNGDLEPERMQVMQGLRPENRPFFEEFQQGITFKKRTMAEHRALRQEFLEKLRQDREARFQPPPPQAPPSPITYAARQRLPLNEPGGQR